MPFMVTLVSVLVSIVTPVAFVRADAGMYILPLLIRTLGEKLNSGRSFAYVTKPQSVAVKYSPGMLRVAVRVDLSYVTVALPSEFANARRGRYNVSFMTMAGSDNATPLTVMDF